MRFSISPAGVLRLLVPVVLVITTASAVVNLIDVRVEAEPIRGFDRLVVLLDVEREANLPTWFSVVLLLVCGLLLWDVGQRRGRGGHRFALHWKVLGLIFVLLSLDELAQLHEIGNALRAVEAVGNTLHLPWLFLAAPLVLVLGLAYLPFVRALPSRTRALLITSAALYLGGALGMELVGSLIWTEGAGYRSSHYLIGVGVEELLEMSGLVLFLYAVASYQQSQAEPAETDGPVAGAARSPLAGTLPAPRTSPEADPARHPGDRTSNVGMT